MRFLLDENFPIQLHRRLRTAGYEADHIITLNLRGIPDAQIRQRLVEEPGLVFLTQDTDFAELAAGMTAVVIISRVPQHLRIAERVELWAEAIDAFVRETPSGTVFELLPSGVVVALSDP